MEDTQAGNIIFYLDETGQHGKICSKEDLGKFNWTDAKEKCETYRGGGYDDWYLPSKGELSLMWTNLADSDGNGENAGSEDINNLGSFVNHYYWSSTEYDVSNAWGQSFYNGVQNVYDLKKFDNNVRAVRAF